MSYQQPCQSHKSTNYTNGQCFPGGFSKYVHRPDSNSCGFTAAPLKLSHPRMHTVPTSIDIVTSGEVVAEGGTLSLECHARATPTPEITWLRNDRPLTFSEKSSKYTVQCSVVADGYSVCLLRVEGALPGEQNDDGKYSCRLDNVVNGTTNVSATVSYQVQIHGK